MKIRDSFKLARIFLACLVACWAVEPRLRFSRARLGRVEPLATARS